MNNIKKLVAISLLSVVSFGSFAETISAWGTTVAEAEAKIAKAAEASNSEYKIQTTRMGNYAYVTAELTK
ncbi:hypothetical protein M2263_003259 [Providencia alcalifaciens]|nr:hypothetical protein [Providencia alcalifaciens]